MIANSENQLSETRAGRRKKLEILNIASEIFLEDGYSEASINEMCRRSGISKHTIYRYFKNKEQLFLAVIDKELEGNLEGLEILDNVPEDQDPEITLSDMGTELGVFLLSRKMMAFRQIIYSECGKHHRIGDAYFSHGPNRAFKSLSLYFEKGRNSGLMWKLPPRTLAESFLALLLHKVTLEQHCKIKEEPNKSICRRLAKKVARDFVAVYLER
jgi:AcrR family transcriptional regulator